MKARLMLAAVLCTLLASTPIAAKTYYKWTDEEGTVHFTSEPPRGRDYESINTSGRVVGTERARSRAEDAEDAEADAAADVQMPREAKPDPEVIAARCRQARENLFWLNNKRRVMVEGDDGEEEFASPEKQQEMIEENQALIDEWCQDQG